MNTTTQPVPAGFLWGSATSAHQTEGNNINSDAWLAEHVTPTLFAEASGDACDSYNRFEEDIGIAASLGLNCYRFGIEWSRIEPEPGEFSVAELERYRRMLLACRARGLAPMLTYSHFTVPRWFAARGGFEAADSPQLFARFAARATAHLGDLIACATTFNEANIQRLVGRMIDKAGMRPVVDAMQAACANACGSERFSSVAFAPADTTEANLIAAHVQATAAIKAGPGDFPVGLTLTMQDVQGVGDNHCAEQVIAGLYGGWLDAARASDFIGVQTYTRMLVGPEGPLPPPEGAELTDAGYEYYPEALAGAIRFAHERIGRPIYVTENGIATTDDSRRVAYISTALAGLRACLDEGIDVRGYIHWSLLDNFEWHLGYSQRFGLVDVDRTSFVRTPKDSARHYAAIVRSGAL